MFFIRKIFTPKGLATAKILLFNVGRILKFERPVGKFLRADVISSFLMFDLFIDIFKSVSVLFFYVWEWILMVGGVLLFMVSVYFLVGPESILFNSFIPFDSLDVRNPVVSLTDSIKDFIFHPHTWVYFYLSKFSSYIEYVLNLKDYIVYNYIVNGFYYFFKTVSFVYYIFSYSFPALYNLLYLAFFGPITFITKLYYFTKTVLYTTLVIGMIFFLNKCYMVWDIICTQSGLMAHMIPDLPSLYYKFNNCILYGLVHPLRTISDSVNGNNFMFLWNLIPSEKLLIQLTFNIMEVSHEVLFNQCANTVLELTNLDNHVFRFAARLLFAPFFFYFKISGTFCGTIGNWLSRWL